MGKKIGLYGKSITKEIHDRITHRSIKYDTLSDNITTCYKILF